MNDSKQHYGHGKQQNGRIKRFAIFLILTATALLIVGCSDDGQSLKTVVPDISQAAPPINTTGSDTDAYPNGGEGVSEPEEAPIHLSDWNLILVNPWNRIPEDFTVELTRIREGQAIDKRVFNDLQAMMDAARAEGLSPLICSSYRTKEKQQALYDDEVLSFLSKGYSPKDAEIEAAKWTAIPGTSEHQIGLAVDIVDWNYQLLDEGQEQTPVQKWLIRNAYRYGFILRYPSEKSDITGINYEPWHYRYVGKDAAKEIYEQGICLEEYLAALRESCQ